MVEFKKFLKLLKDLKAIAKELSVPVVALIATFKSKLNKGTIKNHSYQILRESGSIEQDADVVMFVYREAYYLERKEPRDRQQ